MGITLDAIEYGQHSDVLVLASGDGDFGLLAEKLIAKYETEVEIYGVEGLTAQALIKAASRFIAIDEALLLP